MTPPLRSKPKAKSVGKKATSCSSTNKPNAKRGRPPLFGANNIISDDLTNKIIETLKDRTHLHQNEKRLLESLQAICTPGLEQRENPGKDTGVSEKYNVLTSNNVINEEVSRMMSPVLQNREHLEAHEERLLGQLASVAFRKKKYADSISLPTFCRWRPVTIALVPRQYKKQRT